MTSPNSGSIVLGIDLGTTNSVVAVVGKDGRPEVIRNSDGDETLPSAVYFPSAQQIHVGEFAKQLARQQPNLVATLFKRHCDDQTWARQMHGTTYTALDLSALVLKKLKQDAEAELGVSITQAVITVPAYFGTGERSTVETAAQVAGFTQVRLVNEPTAAALMYAFEKGAPATNVLVYDLGGGTFDATALSISATGSVDVLATDGNHQLGGADFDDLLVRHMEERFLAQLPQGVSVDDPTNDPRTAQAFLLEAEKLKKTLSKKDDARCVLTYEGHSVEVMVTRAEFEQIIENFVEQTMEITARAIEGAQAKQADWSPSRVLLVGGSSRIPMIAPRLHALTRVEPVSYKEDICVALGAALLGTVTAVQDELAAGATVAAVAQHRLLPAATIEHMQKIELNDVNSKALGMVALDGENKSVVAELVPAHTKLPTQFDVTFRTAAPNQTSVKVRVMEQAGQVASEDLANNKEILVGDLTGIPAMIALQPVRVTGTLNADGTFALTAEASGTKLNLHGKLSGSLDPAELAAATAHHSSLRIA